MSFSWMSFTRSSFNHFSLLFTLLVHIWTFHSLSISLLFSFSLSLCSSLSISTPISLLFYYFLSVTFSRFLSFSFSLISLISSLSLFLSLYALCVYLNTYVPRVKSPSVENSMSVPVRNQEEDQHSSPYTHLIHTNFVWIYFPSTKFEFTFRRPNQTTFFPQLKRSFSKEVCNHDSTNRE